ncbi:MAG: xanthine dehydrogenase family protein molybdopterin-binding subunit [Planctomycetes bacterium]|nr:xanthine dehydrogenase family protein molybdopterin-binding subunit [Planctomycetota bacterium]
MSNPTPTNPTSTRRDFLRYSVAGGLSLAFAVSKTGLVARSLQPNQRFDEAGGNADWSPNVFITLAADGTLTIIAHRSEMGTGIRTALPMVVADEMDADWDRVVIQQGDADARYGSQNTDGSRSIRNHMNAVRDAGATARHMLIAAAAKLWSVPASECRADFHTIVHDATKRQIGFGELAASAATMPVPSKEQLQLKTPEQWRYVGKGKPLYDLQDIIDGSAQFGLDIKLPGMKVAVIERCPVLGGVAKKWNEDEVLAVAGVEKVIHLPAAKEPYSFQALGGIAIVARDTWSALQGRKALTVEWDLGKHRNFDSEVQRADLIQSAQHKGTVVRENGDVDAEFGKGGKRISATYDLPHLAHVPMETPCATARVTAASAEVWMPTQTPQSAQRSVAMALRLRPENVTVHVTLLGGGFGRKSKPDYGVEAALLAREVGAPVQVMWTRADDIQHDYFHADSALHFEATLNDDGMPSAWLQRSAFTPIGYTFNPKSKTGSGGEMGQGFSDIPFDIPNLRVENGPADPHLRSGWLRSVCNIFHAFGVNCFADELAHAAGQDPLDYLLALIGEPRHVDLDAMGVQYSNYGGSIVEHPIDTGRLRAVLMRAADNAGFKEGLPSDKELRRGVGIAVHRSFLGYVANVVEVAITDAGQLQIPSVHIAVDCGLAVHPDRVVAQMEGAAVFGVSLAKFGRITAKNGRIEQSNFHDFPVARSIDAPQQINVHIIPSTEPPTGVGEVGVPPLAPALLNAIFDATGKRIRSLPINQHDLSRNPLTD